MKLLWRLFYSRLSADHNQIAGGVKLEVLGLSLDGWPNQGQTYFTEGAIDSSIQAVQTVDLCRGATLVD